jgi:hypothetical protein
LPPATVDDADFPNLGRYLLAVPYVLTFLFHAFVCVRVSWQQPPSWPLLRA